MPSIDTKYLPSIAIVRTKSIDMVLQLLSNECLKSNSIITESTLAQPLIMLFYAIFQMCNRLRFSTYGI